MCIEVDNCAPCIGTRAGTLIASGVGIVIGGVAFGESWAELQAVLKQDPVPENYENQVILNAVALGISGLYILSSLFLAIAVKLRSRCGMCLWVLMTAMEIGALIYGAAHGQTTKLHISLTIVACTLQVWLMIVVCSQCLKVSRNIEYYEF